MTGIKVRYQAFDRLCAVVQKCEKCPRMHGSARVLSRATGPIDAPVMFIGEAPGRLGADNSEIPFHGDKAGENFEELLLSAGLSRRNIFVTNAVLCNPKSESGNNSTPLQSEVVNCASHLRQQIDLVRPDVIATLGAVALKAIQSIEAHGATLRTSVGSAIPWYGRTLVPLYHPGQRAMIHRSLTEQMEDYRFLQSQINNLSKDIVTRHRSGELAVGTIARELVRSLPGISYFALHKLFYLLELDQVRRHGRQLTDGFFVRQQDGPYCTDLHPKKLRKALLSLVGKSNLRVVPTDHDDLFGVGSTDSHIPASTKVEIQEFLMKYRGLDNSELKTKAYLSSPMRELLREEKKASVSLRNAPIDLTK